MSSIYLILLIIGISALIFITTGCHKPVEVEKPKPTPTPLPPIQKEDIDLIKEYGRSSSTAVRWSDFTYVVKDLTNRSDLTRKALDDWEAVLGKNVKFVIDNNAPHSHIVLRIDDSLRDRYARGLCYITVRNSAIISSTILVLPEHLYNRNSSSNYFSLYKHELGHAVGFWAHTNISDCVMRGGTENIRISDTVFRMLNTLYRLTPGDLLTGAEYRTVEDGEYTLID